MSAPDHHTFSESDSALVMGMDDLHLGGPTAATTLHQFADFPDEVQMLIWEAALQGLISLDWALEIQQHRDNAFAVKSIRSRTRRLPLRCATASSIRKTCVKAREAFWRRATTAEAFYVCGGGVTQDDLEEIKQLVRRLKGDTDDNGLLDIAITPAPESTDVFPASQPGINLVFDLRWLNPFAFSRGGDDSARTPDGCLPHMDPRHLWIFTTDFWGAFPQGRLWLEVSGTGEGIDEEWMEKATTVALGDMCIPDSSLRRRKEWEDEIVRACVSEGGRFEILEDHVFDPWGSWPFEPDDDDGSDGSGLDAEFDEGEDRD